ncbi:M12 family metallopeptidase [Haliscomenobacter hydrossis]|uniref:Peptidase M12A astacin n=1 Tax=Haliscomenobacter hydrossis (strain ATCC 27775 / DSM 1100 / LMG 10767 / O) TaxID=760192 RepID=F4KUK6_HALH1|nr:M12 family metallopeptidase [Haliscomenobacter hydrossis]AEE52442.1 peptidase M12A astacin [Haliscomenobacter hydrossis DSM 1100]
MKNASFILITALCILSLSSCQKSDDALSKTITEPQPMTEVSLDELLYPVESTLATYTHNPNLKLVFQGKDSVWVEEADEHYVLDGDMIMPKAIFAERPNYTPELRGALLAGIRPWSNRVVYYQFAPNLPNNLRNNFLMASSQWNKLAGITFRARTNEPNYIWVYPGGEDKADVGMRGGRQIMSLHDGNAGVAMHEIGHALGMAHEHQRSDRNNHIYVQPSVASQSQLRVLSTRNYTSFDFSSIMLYASKKMSNGEYNMVNRATGKFFTNRIEAARNKVPNNPNAYYALPSANDVSTIKAMYN